MTAATDRDLDARVQRELLHLIYTDQPLSLIAAAVFSVAIVVILNQASTPPMVWYWLAAMCGTLLVRYFVALHYQRLAEADRDHSNGTLALLVGSTATAMGWGVIGWIAFPIAPPALRGVVVLLIGGVVAASSRTLACHRLTFTLYAILSSTPLIVRLLVEFESFAWIIGGFALLYILLMHVLGASFRRMVEKSFRLQLENADLAARLREDIENRRSIEAALRASEERLRFAQHALDRAPDLVAIVDHEGNFLHVSDAFCRATACSPEDLARTKIWSGLIGTEQEAFEKRWHEVKRLGSLTYESTVLSRKGDVHPVEVTASFVEFNGREAMCTISRDLAPRRAAELEKARMQHQLQETQRLESLGVLAGGIAHDFNNLLTAILGNATLARDTLNKPRAVAEMLGQIEGAANQAAGLCRQMLAYAGRGQLLIEPLNPSLVIGEMAKLLETTIGRRARLELNLARDLPFVAADASQLRQIVLNLAHNASEAITRPDGRVVVTTSRINIDAALIDRARIRSEIAEGPGVAIFVTDNGGGMSPETLEHIFEPFFTTKFAGRGLGLPAVLGIVRSHRALLHVDSTVGHGSTFQVTFAATATRPKATTGNSPTMQRRQGNVLVLDDEESVRRVARQVLERFGFAVTAVPDTESALRACAGGVAFNLLLVDLTLPGTDGVSALRDLRKHGVAAPAVIMSGFSEEQVRERFAGERAAGFLQKPFDVTTLRDKVMAALPAENPPPGGAIPAAPPRPGA